MKERRAGDTPELRAGQLVEVRRADEIMATLDANGELENLPFMPEMLQYCGRRFTVASVAHKLCDTQTRTGMRRMNDAVHLTGIRCDGQAHDGCQASCLIYFKSAWLKPVDGPLAATSGAEAVISDNARLLPMLMAASRKAPAEDGAEVYSCQATELLRAAPERLPLLQLGQYVDDVRSGNVSVWRALRAFLVGLFNRIQGLSNRFLPRRLRFRGGLPWRFLKGAAVKTPMVRTDLRVGELVRIKSKEEIMKTLNRDLLNRGMGFDAEMSRFCGRTARVARRVERIIDERTGRMLQMRGPCVVLEGIVCEGAYNASCPRSITPYWREVWLERVEEPRDHSDVLPGQLVNQGRAWPPLEPAGDDRQYPLTR